MGKIYDVLEDETAIARRVDYLLEKDTFMCSRNGYEIGAPSLNNLLLMTNRYYAWLRN